MFENFNSPAEKKESLVNLASAENLVAASEAELSEHGTLSEESLDTLQEKVKDLIDVQNSLSTPAEQAEVGAMIAKLKDIQSRNGLKEAA